MITLPSIRPRITGFVTGCFDLFHQGHRRLLQQAANNCDKLTIAVNRDEYCRRVKGPHRPHVPLYERIEVVRAYVAAALPLEEFTIRVQMEDTPRALISIIRPDVLILGDDYAGQILPGVQYVQRVVFVPRLSGHSTTSMLGSPRIPESAK